jgi:AraC-like DNA-binding protein
LNDESHFVRDFKSTYGFSPAIYRSHFKNNGAAKDAHNGHNGNGKSNNGSEVRQQLTEVLKQSILPSLNLVVCLVSYLN